ncbi:hypothetical protein [Mucilaginibacter sp.]|uniref:hypothetical protein n=1 Tax=Mucilaginibacter sp. TaxID=1882438 RepID=UPI002ED10DA5
MKKKYTFLVFLLFIGISICKAQQYNYQPGYAILSDGTRISGMIRIFDDEPWYNQRFIRIKDSAAFVKDPNVKAKLVKVDELKYYEVAGRKYDKVHYVDLENLQLKSLGTNDHMMERLSTGRINAHRFYQYPPDTEGYIGTEEDFKKKIEQEKADLRRGYKILTQKDNESKLQNAFDYDLQKYFEDTPEVLEKYKSGGYGNQPIVKRGFAGRMIAMAKKNAFKQEEADGIVAAFNDYNSKNVAK